MVGHILYFVESELKKLWEFFSSPRMNTNVRVQKQAKVEQ
jgi:hypothetical protein